VRNILRALLIVTVVLPLTAGAPRLPRQLAEARYVTLGFETASGFVSEYDFKHMAGNREDRRALESVRGALKQWGKYHITTPDAAELLIALRAGRVASGNVGGGASGGTNQEPAGDVFVGGDLGSRADLLAVYSADHISGPGVEASSSATTMDAGRDDPSSLGVGRTRRGALLWRASAIYGFQGTTLPLVERFKTDVETVAAKKKK
jgi:hypothetical protein